MAQRDRDPERKQDPKEVARLVALVAIAVLFIAFAVANSTTVRVDFVFLNADLRLIWVIILSAALGAVADRLFVVWRRRTRPPRPPRQPPQPS